MYGNRSTLAFTCEIYVNDTAWQHEPEPEPNTWWEKGVFQFFNPDPTHIETVIQRWLPAFTYITNRAINEFQYHDVGVINVNPSKTIVGQGYTMNINVTVTNRGDYTETFNVTLYANTTAINTKTITVQNDASATLTFVWNTTGYAKGKYTIWVYAWQLQGETYTEDNTKIGCIITVTIPGDINADKTVNILDCILIGVSFGSQPNKPNWNPNADINNDNKINILDALIIAKNFGQKDPSHFLNFQY